MNKLLPISLLAILLAGCSGGPKSVVKNPGPANVNGGVLAESSDKSVSIVIPPGWKRGSENTFSMSSMGLGDMGSGMSSGDGSTPTPSPDDQAAEAAEAKALEEKGILVWANDSSKPIPGEERTHFSVKFIKDAGQSLDQAVEEAKGDIMGEGAPTDVELPIGKAKRLQSKVTRVDGGELNTILYVLVNGDDTYRVRFVTQNGDQVLPQVEKPVIESLRIKPATP